MYLQDEIQNLKKRLISGDYKNEDNLFILREINDILIYGQIQIEDEGFFIQKYQEIIGYIDDNKLYKDNFDYLEYKAYFYYLNGKTQRLLTLINSYRLFKNNELLLLLIELLIKDNYDKKDVFEYVTIILDNGIDSIYTFRKLKSLLVGKYEFDLSDIDENHYTYNNKVPQFLYRISRLENLQSILEYGLLSRNKAREICFINNSYDHIQDRRSNFEAYNLHNYVPLFFSKYPPMLYSNMVKNNINNQLIFIIDGNIFQNEGVIFSDISLAYKEASDRNIFNNIKSLKYINFSVFNNIGWENNINLRKIKGAEVLVKEKIDTRFIKEIIFFDKNNKLFIEKILKDNGFNITITYKDYEDYKG